MRNGGFWLVDYSFQISRIINMSTILFIAYFLSDIFLKIHKNLVEPILLALSHDWGHWGTEKLKTLVQVHMVKSQEYKREASQNVNAHLKPLLALHLLIFH